MKFIAVQPVWDWVKGEIVSPPKEFDMTLESGMSLVRIGAAKLPEEEVVVVETVK